MKRTVLLSAISAAVLIAPLSIALDRFAQAQPANGAGAAFERVRDVMQNRFQNLKLVGDPDRDFADLLNASNEELIYLAKTQLEYGGDRLLRDVAQRISEEQRKEIDSIKQWKVRRQEADYKAQPDQPQPGSGPLDRRAQAVPAPAPAQAAPQAPPSPGNTPLVAGTIESIDSAQSKVTLDHGPIPNLNMDGMTMAWRVQDAAMLKPLKKGDKVQFSADRVNGSLMVTRLQKVK